MKKMKLISGLMAMAMTALSMSAVVNAADSVSVSIGNAEVKAGENFTVDVSLASVPSSGINSVDFAIGYDSSVLDITGVSLGTVGDTGAASKEGDLGDTVFTTYKGSDQYVVIWSTGLEDSSNWIKQSGVFLTISGTVKSDAQPGTSALKIEPVAREAYPQAGSANSAIVFENAGTPATVNATDGSVTIKGSEVGATLWGDADCSGLVDISDVILVSRIAAEDTTVSLTAAGKSNANCQADSNIDGKDAVAILKLVARLLDQSDMPLK